MSTTTRRDFIKQAGTLGVCACCMGATSFIESCSSAKGITGTETADMVTVPIATFKDSNSTLIKTKKYPENIYVAKQADGTYLALLMHCPHKGCEVNASPDKFVCPCHGSQFTLTGGLIKGPAKEGLKSFKVEEQKQLVVIHFM